MAFDKYLLDKLFYDLEKLWGTLLLLLQLIKQLVVLKFIANVHTLLNVLHNYI